MRRMQENSNELFQAQTATTETFDQLDVLMMMMMMMVMMMNDMRRLRTTANPPKIPCVSSTEDEVEFNNELGEDDRAPAILGEVVQKCSWVKRKRSNDNARCTHAFLFIPLREESVVLNEHCCVIRSRLHSEVLDRQHLVLLEDLSFIVANQSILKMMYRTSMSTDSIGRNASHAIIHSIGKI